jgi:hypothetical protein
VITELLRDQVDKKACRSALTRACFADLRELGRPLLIATDRFESAPTDERDWIADELLQLVAETDTLRLVIAGRSVPRIRFDLNQCCVVDDLIPVSEPRDWMEVMTALLPNKSTEFWQGWLEFACDRR